MLSLRLIDPLEKVFPDTAPQSLKKDAAGFENEHIFLQLAVNCDETLHRKAVKLVITSAFGDAVNVRIVKCVPVMLATLAGADEDYLRKTPGLYPDLLKDRCEFTLLCGTWQSLVIEIDPKGFAPGDYPVTLSVCRRRGDVLGQATANVTIFPGALPEQKLIRTQWFHSDCLATYYSVDVFSEEYWRIVENFMRAAVRRGCNMILTPLFTPPLDTAVGGERPTVQLIDVKKEGENYTFGFEKLHRFVKTAKSVGMRWFEMSHLFTQWGAKHAPKIMADVDGACTRIFGWETEACSAEYAAFLKAFLPALVCELRALGIFEYTYFHISDEPNEDMLSDYRAARALVEPYVDGRPIIDALSSVELYKQGAVSHPIPGINHLLPFLEAQMPQVWTYYCVGQYKNESNVFIAMPGARTRMLGVQLYKYNVEGFLQWGFNFYNTQGSLYAVDPYLSTDADGALPAGDPFIVYPGPGGQAEESLRALYMGMAMQDLRALQWLEKLIGREKVLALIEDTAGVLTLTEYPYDMAFFTRLRERVNAQILLNT